MSEYFEGVIVPSIICNCGRSSTGFCVGLHALTREQYDQYIIEGHVYPGELPTEEKPSNES